jgi:hypothetical protein
MAANQKLTGVLRGRTATQITWAGTTAVVQFDDGSAMTVQTSTASGGAGTGGPPPAALPVAGAAAGSSASPSDGPTAALGRVRGVRQQDTILCLDFETGPTLTLRTAEATSSVIVRARDHTLEYAD